MTSEIYLSTPQIAQLPSGITPRLLDFGMLNLEASLAGSAERYRRGETSHTIHVWWARRPHSAMRSLVFASLCKDNSFESRSILKILGSKPKVSTVTISKARETIKMQYQNLPRLLDMFGGGGTIPMEACSLGADTYSIDANQMSVFIQLSNIVYPQRCHHENIGDLIKETGRRILTKFAEDSSPLFPLRRKTLLGYDIKSPCTYLWTYSLVCPVCSYRFYLSKRPWLSKKRGKRKSIVIVQGSNNQSISIEDGKEEKNIDSAWYGKNGTVQCPKCNTLINKIDIKQCQDELVALISLSDRKGKEFSIGSCDAIPNISEIENMEQTILNELSIKLPTSSLPIWSGIVNPSIYGMRTHADFFNIRQRVCMLLLIKELTREYERLKSEQGEITAKYIISVLSSLVDQLVDWNCRLSMWIPQNEQVGRAFCGPGVSMLWDYAEIDPILGGPANLWGKLTRIVSGIHYFEKCIYTPHIQHAYAQNLPFEDNFFDAIITDPPYYDNIYYNVLADFFYTWKRLLLQKIEPELFSKEVTHSNYELVASKFKSGTSEKAHSDYCEQLGRALLEAERVIKPDGIFGFLYTHSSIKGWVALVKAYRVTRFLITSVQPLSIERRQRPRAMTAAAVNTCIAFVAHKTRKKKAETTLEKIIHKLMIICHRVKPSLLEAGWSQEDAGMAIFANGVGMIANSSKITDCANDDAALRGISIAMSKEFPGFYLTDRVSL